MNSFFRDLLDFDMTWGTAFQALSQWAETAVLVGGWPALLVIIAACIWLSLKFPLTHGMASMTYADVFKNTIRIGIFGSLFIVWQIFLQILRALRSIARSIVP